MTAETSEKLAVALDDVGLYTLAARARKDEFHDFRSPHATPTTLLVSMLHKASILEKDPIMEKQILRLRNRVINGDFDASVAESEEWAKGPEGQDAFNRLIRGE